MPSSPKSDPSLSTTPPTRRNDTLDHADPIDLARVRNLVFQGGSVKGTAYGGAVGGLEAAFKKKGDLKSNYIDNLIIKRVIALCIFEIVLKFQFLSIFHNQSRNISNFSLEN